MLNNVYEDSYYRTIYELGKSNAVIDTAFGTIDENLLIKPKEIQQSSNPKSESEVSLKPAENAVKTTQDKPKVEVTPNKVDTKTKAEKPAETAETASEKTQSTPSVPKVSEEVQEAVNEPWAADNKIVDDRLGDNANDLVEKVRKEVEARVTRGESTDKMVDAISKELEADRKRVERIVRTETAAIQNKASIDAYKALGVDKIQVLGTLDRVTCEKCGSFDGKIFEIDKAQQGISEPPFHPNCRCTTVPYDEDWGYKGQRIAKDDNGNDYYVPEDMSYEEWKRKYVDGDTKDEKIKSLRNGKPQTAFIEEYGVDEEAYNEAVQKAQQIIDKYKSLYIGDLSMSLAAEYLNADDIAAIEAYMTSNIAYSLNYQLRNGKNLSPELEDVKRSIDTALAKLPDYAGVVYRSLSKDDLDDIEAFYQQHQVGNLITYPAYTSASKGVYDDTMPIQFIIKSKRGKNISDINELESEVLFKRATTFYIEKVDGDIFYLREF